ncbi:hypothetical protein BS50DRAFT_489025 [Corynespora cassiicola Philippines]|uniref:Zn(2)-C6 fungal-type domain-containing protein n=1 Tax=Corynespora cassiicola Philippines TaxID=1448308 RepID=A0A2T2NZE5_CORCC|nr:hypothetical protein BS50DRAFT_489025 [Corynespora cassiicola Philippines]
MLGYISSTRRKSCHACVKSKRRCDLGYPCCKRCLAKSLECVYPHSAREAEVVIRQTTPDLIPIQSDARATGQSQAHPSIDPTLLSRDGFLRLIVTAEPQIGKDLVPQIWEPTILNHDQVMSMINSLCAFIPSLAYTGHTLFIHKTLYEGHQPAAYQDSCSLAALYLLKTNSNANVLMNSIDSKIVSLISRSKDWSLLEHLAAVQALIIYQVMRLFDPDINMQIQASKHIKLLELWTAHLWKRSFNSPETFPTCHESWVFYESLRRTVLFSTLVSGAWSCITKAGLCDKVPILARLPFTNSQRMWDCDSAEWQESRPCATVSGEQRPYLIAYGDLSKSWTYDAQVEELSTFERMLLAPCRGGDDPRLLDV